MYKSYELTHVESYDWNLAEQKLDPTEAMVAVNSSACSITRESVAKCLKDIVGNNRYGETIAIDGGCGVGRWCYYISINHGIVCHGIDLNLSDDQIRNAELLGIKLLRCSILELPYENEHIDFYMSLGVFEHFEKGISVPLKEAYRVLKPGGKLLITVPFHSYLRRVLYPVWHLRRIITRLSYGRKRKFSAYFFTKDDITKEVEKAGFIVDKITAADNIGIGLYIDFAFLRSKRDGIFPLNNVGKLVFSFLNYFSVYFTTWGMLCVAQKGHSRDVK